MRNIIFLFLIFGIINCKSLFANSLSNQNSIPNQAQTQHNETDELIFDDDVMLDMEEKSSQIEGESDRQNQQSGSVLETLLKSFKTTLEFEYSHKTAAPQKNVKNRFSARIEYEYFFADYFFFKIDTKITAHHYHDHIAQAEEKDLVIKTNTREAFLQSSFGGTSIKAGRQIIVWGEADGVAVTDAVSPRDKSEWMFISLDESRISQNMLLIEQFTGIGDFSLFFTPEAEMDKNPISGSEYDLNLFDSSLYQVTEEDSLNDPEYGFRWKKTFGRSDIALMVAKLIDNQPTYKANGSTIDGRIRLTKSGQYYTMTGITANYASGNFLWKGEIAQKDKKTFNTSRLDIVERKVYDTAIGFDYTPVSGYSINLTYINSHINNWNETIATAKEDDGTIALGWSDSYLNEDLDISLTATQTVYYTDRIGNITIDYTLDDFTSLIIDVVILDIKNEDSPLYAFRDQNRISAGLTIQF